MKTEVHHSLKDLAREVALSERKLQSLAAEIHEIGQPAAHELQKRLDALKIEEKALQRNLLALLETGAGPEDRRWHKVEALLEWIATEEDSLGHEADFLHQSGKTSSEIAAQAGVHLVELVLRALKRVVGSHHPLGMSVFVNHTHKALAEQYGLKDDIPGN